MAPRQRRLDSSHAAFDNVRARALNAAVLQTWRLVLREMHAGDLEYVASLLADPEVMHSFGQPCTREQAAAWIRRQEDRYAGDGYGYWLALDKATGHPIGQAGVLKVTVDGVEEAALGYMIGRAFWGRGLATEAVAACRDYVLDRLGRARAITLVRPENLASQRVAVKIGMKPERRTRFAGFEHIVFAVSRPLSREGG